MTQYVNYVIILAVFFALTGCKKETALSPTNQDENYLVVKDNPNDPVDHQLYLFYQSTGIAGFYSDTVAKNKSIRVVTRSRNILTSCLLFLILLFWQKRLLTNINTKQATDCSITRTPSIRRATEYS